jgi:hypothetical protein
MTQIGQAEEDSSVMFQVMMLIVGEAIKLRFVLRFLVKDLRIATTTVNGQIVTWTP